MKKIYQTLFCLLFAFMQNQSAFAQNHTLVGYWHNWNDANVPYLPLDNISSKYDYIDISFATPKAGTSYKMEFTPDVVTDATFKNQVLNLQAQNKKVIISIGGANAQVVLNTTAERDTFVSTMTSIINNYHFDGMDIDLEGNSVLITGGTISQPIDAKIINLISAIQQIMNNFRTQYGKKMILTMAPETAYVQGGMSGFGNIWGAYLPVIQGLKDSLDILHVQLYNSGTMYGIDQQIYTQGTADFIVAMTEAVIKGFNTQGGLFSGLPPEKVSVGLPSCPSAAGGGFTDSNTVKAAIKYLRGMGAKPGTYTLQQAGGYPNLRGMMTWSINWDAVSHCNNSPYQYASTYQSLFGTPTPNSIAEINMENGLILYPNPAHDLLKLNQGTYSEQKISFEIYNFMGTCILKNKLNINTESINISSLTPGIYILKIGSSYSKFFKQ